MMRFFVIIFSLMITAGSLSAQDLHGLPPFERAISVMERFP